MMTRRVWLYRAWCTAVVVTAALAARSGVTAQDAGPQMLDPTLSVRTVASGFNLPIGLAFLAPNDLLVLEGATGSAKSTRPVVV